MIGKVSGITDRTSGVTGPANNDCECVYCEGRAQDNFWSPARTLLTISRL